MFDDLIDDEVRKSFPGWTDKDIYDFWVLAKTVEKKEVPTVFESDVAHARMIRELGWVAFKEYLLVTTGTDSLEPNDYVALAEASAFLRELENASLYMAIYGSASEIKSKKTAATRNQSYKQLVAGIGKIEIAKGI